MKTTLTDCLRELKNDLVREFKLSLDDTEKRLAERLDRHETEIDNLKSRVEMIENSESGVSAADKEDLLTELDERRTRAHNVITFGLQQDLNGKSDTDLINEIFAEITDFPRAITATRIGKPRDNEPMPLKVTFDSHSDALFVLRNKEKLNKHKLSVRNDKTPNQQNYMKSLQSELSARTNNGEKDLRIKYEKGVPHIVKATKKRNANQKN